MPNNEVALEIKINQGNQVGLRECDKVVLSSTQYWSPWV